MIYEGDFWSGVNNPDLSLGETDVGIIGIPYDTAASGGKGAKDAPDRIRKVSATYPSRFTEQNKDIGKLRLKDFGDVQIPPLDPEQTGKRIRGKVKKLLNNDVLTVCVGGDHSVTFPAIEAHSQARDISIVWIDAHPDLIDVHNESKYSHGCPLRRSLELDSVREENVILVGIRDFTKGEMDYINESEIEVIYAHELSKMNVGEVAKVIENRVSGSENTYLSFDIDVLDPSHAPGTGYPNPGGLSSRKLFDLIHSLKDINVAGFDVVEVAPPLDVNDITSLAAVKIIYEMLSLRL